MRAAFARTLTELAERDPRVVLLTADLGYMVLEPFAEQFPDRFFNVGVAEQNMVGLATGLAEAGMIPFVYSIVNFAVLRPFEFIRNGPVMHRLPVRVVGVGGGLEYGPNGPTHHGTEDVGAMRLLNGMSVVAPADARQARTALFETWDLPGPVYYRLGKDDKPEVPGLDGRFELGRAQILHPGGDVMIVAMGGIAVEAAAAAEQLRAAGIDCGLTVVASLSPPPVGDLVGALSRVPVAVTVEAHAVVGGVGSLVSEVVAENGLGCRVIRRGVGTPPDGVSGSQRYLQHAHGISRESLVECAVGAVSQAGHAKV